MIEVLALRHGATAWNEAGRIQGRADPPLSAAGRREVATWRLPPGPGPVRCLTSPLRRACETAALLGFAEATVEPRLIEMDWGAWQGACLAELRARDPAGLRRNEARGLDLRPPGGESPREVMARVGALLGELPLTFAAERVLLVTHKGVVRALMAAASGWPMLGRPPVRLGPGDALRLVLDGMGRPRPGGVVRLAAEPVG